MKKIIVVAVIMSILVFAAISFATTINISRVEDYYSGVGGEFNIIIEDASYRNAVNSRYNQNALVERTITINNVTSVYKGFESFCLEYAEHVNTPGRYNATVNPLYQAVEGGSNEGHDTISIGTAYLYSQFAKGILSGYNYTLGSARETSAAELQNAIWWLEDETGGNISAYQALLISEFGSLENAKKDVTSANNYGVGVLNLTTFTNGLAQDQLVLVPEPSILLLLGFGLVGVGVLRGRK